MDIRKMIHKLVGVYRKLPLKPFHKILVRIYRRYTVFHRGKVLIAVREGIKWELDLNEYIDSSIYYQGLFKPNTVHVINNTVEKGMTVLDIGANIGCHTLRFAKLVGAEGKVIAIEPMSWALSKLKKNIALNDFNNIILDKMAISDRSVGEQIVQFQASWPLYGDLLDGSIHSVHPEENAVEVITLDDYVAKRNIKRIDFIKVAVNGYEYKVIKGGINTIKKFQPVMIIEFSKYAPKWYGDTLDGLIDLLYSLGYSCYSDIDFKRYKDSKSVLSVVPSHETRNLLVKARRVENRI
jgi:FkbM family methyltransferase